MLAACTQVGPEQSAAHAPAMDWHRDPSELAIERWQSVRGAVSADCADYARSVEVVWVDDAADLNARCGLGYSVVGCFEPSDTAPKMLVRGDALAGTLVHEMMHALEACVQHTVDNQHSDAQLWRGLMAHDAE